MAWNQVGDPVDLAGVGSQDFDITQGGEYYLDLVGLTTASTARLQLVALSDSSTLGNVHNYDYSLRTGPTYSDVTGTGNGVGYFEVWPRIAKTGQTTDAEAGTNVQPHFIVADDGSRLSGHATALGERFATSDNELSADLEYAAFGLDDGAHDCDGIRVGPDTGVFAAGTATLYKWVGG